MDESPAQADASGTAMTAAPGNLPILAAPKLGELIPASRFNASELAQVETIAKGIDFTDAASILAQMNAPNQKFADAITKELGNVAVYETGAAAGIILELSRQIKSANLAKMQRETKGEDWVAATFGSLPLIGPQVSAIRHFQLNHKRLVDELMRIRDQAQAEITRLRGVHYQLESQEHATETVLRELMVHIAACQRATTAAREQFDKQRAQALEGDRDPFVIQRLSDVADNIVMMETRLINAKASFLEKMLSLPDIRARQTAARIEISNTIDTIQNDLPDLASAIGRLVASYHIAQSQKANELRRRNREELSKANADALDDVYLAAKNSQSGAAEQINQLSQRVARLMSTLDKGAQIDANNVKSRAESEAKLIEIRDSLIDGMAANADRALRSA
jgi:archaellum component FlaC